MVEITDAASKKIRRHLQLRGKGAGIRIGVKTTGCSGLAYVLEYFDQPMDTDLIAESNECTVAIDPKSAIYLKGVKVDYVRNGLNEGFEFLNPNERDRCGCGESFRV